MKEGIYLVFDNHTNISLPYFLSRRSVSSSRRDFSPGKPFIIISILLQKSDFYPTKMPSIIQFALIFEALVTFPPGAMLVVAPNWTLSKLLPTTTILAGIPASTTSLAQTVGSLLVALTVPLALSISDRPHVAETRRMAYWLLGAGEALLIPLLLAKEGSSGFEDGILKTGAVQMAPFLVWRVIVLLGKPEWLAGGSASEKKRQ